MEDIKVGDYIRTKDGVIAKVTRIDISMVDCDRDVFDLDNGAMMEIPCEYIQEYIVKHSPNLIDLIEVGDYVNGYKILEMKDSIYKKSKRILIFISEKLKYERWIYIQEHDGKIHTQDDIVSVATKEQFKSIEYVV